MKRAATPRWAKSWAKAAVRRMGLDVSTHPRYLSHDWLLREVISEASVDLVIDVGAHWGSFVQEVRSLGYEGDIVCVEPIVSSYERLRGIVESDPRCSAHRVALGSRSGEIEMFVHPGQSWLNSARPLNAFGERHFATAGGTPEHVPLERLDDFVARLGLDLTRRRVFLKVDTQGLDFEVLDGGAATIDRVAVLRLEVSARAVYEGTATLGTQLDRLLSMGFDIVDLAPVARAGLRLLELDALLVRREP